MHIHRDQKGNHMQSNLLGRQFIVNTNKPDLEGFAAEIVGYADNKTQGIQFLIKPEFGPARALLQWVVATQIQLID